MQNIANNADAQDAAQAATAKAAKECACGNFTDAATGESLVCHSETTRTFAPGHDARLKGFLIRVGRKEHEVRVLGERDRVTATEAASRFGFGHMVAEGIARPAKAKKAPAAAEAPALVVAKVGRWTYLGTVADGVFSYEDKQGNAKTTTAFTV